MADAFTELEDNIDLSRGNNNKTGITLLTGFLDRTLYQQL